MENQLNPIEVQAWIDTLNAQKISLSNEIVMLRGILALRDAEIAGLKKSQNSQEVRVNS